MIKSKIVGHGHIKKPKLFLLKTKDNYWEHDACYNFKETAIKIDLLVCEKGAKESNIEYYEFVARCLNHEYLHHWLDIEESEEASHKLDNIALEYIDYWLW